MPYSATRVICAVDCERNALPLACQMVHFVQLSDTLSTNLFEDRSMRVSIIIPAYNSQRYLAATLDSVLAQTVPDWELVIVDDGSSDDTPQIVQQYSRRDNRIRSIRQENAGIARARNRGLKETSSSSEFVAFLDHDDVWEPDALEVLIAALEQNPKCPAAHGLSRFIDAEGKPVFVGELEKDQATRRYVLGRKVAELSVEPPTSFEVEMFQNKISTVGQAMVRRSFFNGEPAFDARWVPCDDWDLYLRLTLAGGIAFVPKVTIGWRTHQTNTSLDRNAMYSMADILREHYAENAGFSLEVRDKVRLANRFWYRWQLLLRLNWAKDRLLHGDPIGAAKQVRHFLLGYGRLLREPDKSPNRYLAGSQPVRSPARP